MKFSEAKVIVARSTGDQHDPDLSQAGDAILAAIRDFNTEHNWEFKFREEIAYPLAAGASEITIPGLKKVHTLRQTSPSTKTLVYTRLRTLDYMVRNQDPGIEPSIYTVIENPLQNVIRLYPPALSASTFMVRYYEEIAEPAQDDDVLDVPTRFQNALLARAKYHYLLDQDTENTRCDKYENMSAQQLRRAIRDDKKQPDEIEQTFSRIEYGAAFGTDPQDWDSYPFGI